MNFSDQSMHLVECFWRKPNWCAENIYCFSIGINFWKSNFSKTL